ncbi:hypothetical protein MBLNU230_g2237t1 [Neophaeotheca triangularis]
MASRTTLDTPALRSKSLRMSYRIARGEQGVLTFEPYKSLLLPLWRFRTISIAKTSSAELWRAFQNYVAAGDFVGADMARKFIQMGMTRAARYANHQGGRKYESDGEGGKREKEKGKAFEGREEKRGASEVFKAVWKNCREYEEYLRLKGEFQREQKEWDKSQKGKVKRENAKGDDLKQEIKDEDVKQEEEAG